MLSHILFLNCANCKKYVYEAIVRKSIRFFFSFTQNVLLKMAIVVLAGRYYDENCPHILYKISKIHVGLVKRRLAK